MAGRPMQRGFNKTLQAHLKETGKGEDELIFDRIIAGETIKSITAQLDEELGWQELPWSNGPLHLKFLFNWLYKTRKEEYKEAKRLSANCLVEDSLGILDDLAGEDEFSAAQVSLALARTNFRKWLAGKRNEEYADKADVEINVSVGSLHLDALRAAGGPAPALPQPEDTEMIEEAQIEVIGPGELEELM